MPLADDIIASWRDEPDRWRWHVIWMRRDDGIEVCMQQPYTSNTDFAVMLHPDRGRIEFGWWDKRRLKKALRQWKNRPLVQENSDAANN